MVLIVEIHNLSADLLQNHVSAAVQIFLSEIMWAECALERDSHKVKGHKAEKIPIRQHEKLTQEICCYASRWCYIDVFLLQAVPILGEKAKSAGQRNLPLQGAWKCTIDL